jgi:hypothetical protein
VHGPEALEHAFRKLGVTNRLAAAIAFETLRTTESTQVNSVDEFA